MAQYTVNDALEELNELRNNLKLRLDDFLSKREVEKVAYLLFTLENEIGAIEKEAMRLRLRGELDVSVYRTLIKGYYEFMRLILEESAKHGVERDVKNYYAYLRAEHALNMRPSGE